MIVSVITVNLNNAQGLEKTVNSVLMQTVDIDYIVIDGGSIDGSVDIIIKKQDKINFWVSEKDRGIYHAMNKGIQKAVGSYYMFLNSGDELFESRTIEKCIAQISEKQNIDILYGDIFLTNSLIIGQNNTIKKMPKTLDLPFFRNNTINHQASLYRADLFKEFGLYPDNYEIASDYWLLLNSIISEKVFSYIDDVMVKYDLSGISVRSFEKYHNETRIIWENLLPKVALDLSKQNDLLLSENQDLKSIMQYKIIKVALRLNQLLQKLK